MDNRDAVTKKYFNKKIDFDPGGISEFHGIEITKENAFKLTGAPDGSKITCEKRPSDHGVEMLVFDVVNDQLFEIKAFRTLVRDDESADFYLKNDNLELKEKNTGLGTIMFAHQAFGAKSLGMKVITLEGGNGKNLEGREMWGYDLWAKCGFDATLTNNFLKIKSYVERGGVSDSWRDEDYRTEKMTWYKWLLSLSVDGKIPATIQELISSEAGKNKWLKCPLSIEMRFDLADDSNSWNVLKNRMQEKGIFI